ncbi:CDP-diacylglycerol--glycerol-3-phosphate 3-phosphatidyltransferase [Burkholderia sp. b14]|nr:CDP-diacylglycerol--glycerol-3-phosphate 3-phosphatidyltransferase [Burkholderia sp. b14]
MVAGARELLACDAPDHAAQWQLCATFHHQFASMPFNLPIFLTWLRIVLIPLIVGVYYLPDTMLVAQDKNEAAAAIFILAALTDWFDGFLARKLNQTSAFGAFLDPVADKLMVTAALLVLVHLMRLDSAIALVIVGREITISALREWMAQIGASKSVAVNSLGKFKTACQMIAIPMLLYYAPIGVPGQFAINTRVVGEWLIYLAAVLTIWSMLYYMKLAWPQIRDRAT